MLKPDSTAFKATIQLTRCNLSFLIGNSLQIVTLVFVSSSVMLKRMDSFCLFPCNRIQENPQITTLVFRVQSVFLTCRTIRHFLSHVEHEMMSLRTRHSPYSSNFHLTFLECQVCRTSCALKSCDSFQGCTFFFYFEQIF